MTEIVFRPIASNPTRVAALLSGELDLIDPLPLDDVERIRQTPGFKVISGPSARTIMLGLDTRNAELEGSNIKGEESVHGYPRAPGGAPGDQHRRADRQDP